MNEIYSEKELLPSGLSFGQWEFALSDNQIREKLDLLPKNTNDVDDDCGHWKTLLSLVTPKGDEKPNNGITESDSVVCLDEESEMECSFGTDRLEDGNINESVVTSSKFEDLTVSLVDTCNQAAQKVKSGFDCVKAELENLSESFDATSEHLLCKVMEHAWPQLNSDSSKLCFCFTFCMKCDRCVILCKNVILPWMSKSLPSKLEQYSEIFSKQGEVVCKNLIAPLLQTEDSPLVKDLPSLEEIMSSMSKPHWTVLFKSLLSGLNELPGWFLPVLAEVVQHADLSFDDISGLVQLMSSTGLKFTKSRDFGALLDAVANSIKPSFGVVVPQLKLITNNYKGPLKFKVLKVLKDITD